MPNASTQTATRVWVTVPESLLPTGSVVLDDALGGGMPTGLATLVSADAGAGGAEFVFAHLRAVAEKSHGKARVVSALRSPARVERDVRGALDADALAHFDVRPARSGMATADVFQALADLHAGDVLLVESADALASADGAKALIDTWRAVAEKTAETGACAILLHATGSLPRDVEVALEEAADSVFRFAWREGGPTMRRVLEIVKFPGHGAVLDAERVPIFDLAIQKGAGFSISRVKNVL